MRFSDHFSANSEVYKRFRPRYPDRLFLILRELAPNHDSAWDCATGNGQAALGLAKHFRFVLASDGSASQISRATPADNVHYFIALAEHSAIASSSVNLVAVAEAMHWFDTAAFFCEAQRVLTHDGILAAWSYGCTRIDAEINAIVASFKDDFLNPYWPPEAKRASVCGYPFPNSFIELPVQPSLEIEIAWSFQEFLGYIGSWSAVAKYAHDHQCSPLIKVHNDLLRAWGNPEGKRIVRWTIDMRVGRCRK